MTNSIIKDKNKLLKIYNILLKAFGPQNWWPAKTKFEIIVGAILTQNTAWKNVEKAISNLRAEGVLSFKGIKNIDEKDLARLIRSAGYFNQKSKKLKAFIEFAIDKYDGSLARMIEEDHWVLRKNLLGVFGIGKETADSILLYAFNKPVFVVDIYTYRVLIRHGIIPKNSSYDFIQDFFMKNLPRDIFLYNEYHALLVHLGNKFCRAKPICEQCPLKNINPKSEYP